MAKKKSVSLGEALTTGRGVRLYGRLVEGFTPPKEITPPGFNDTKLGAANFAVIRAFSVMSACRELPVPVIFLVPGAGEDVSEGDRCGRPGEELVWELAGLDGAAVLSIETGSLFELLSTAETRGIDGGLQIENPRFENGQLCATVHAWAKIEVFGKKIGFDERVGVCIPLQGCYPIWSIDIARIEACFRAPSELCVQLVVGKWGLEKRWDACAHIPLAAANSICPPPAPKQACCCASKAPASYAA